MLRPHGKAPLPIRSRGIPPSARMGEPQHRWLVTQEKAVIVLEHGADICDVRGDRAHGGVHHDAVGVKAVPRAWLADGETIRIVVVLFSCGRAAGDRELDRPLQAPPGDRPGGMGVVLMAEQERPVCRRVALKVIRAGMDSSQVVAGFEAERQALAMMDHPSAGSAGLPAAGLALPGLLLPETIRPVSNVVYVEASRSKPRTTRLARILRGRFRRRNSAWRASTTSSRGSKTCSGRRRAGWRRRA